MWFEVDMKRLRRKHQRNRWKRKKQTLFTQLRADYLTVTGGPLELYTFLKVLEVNELDLKGTIPFSIQSPLFVEFTQFYQFLHFFFIFSSFSSSSLFFFIKSQQGRKLYLLNTLQTAIEKSLGKKKFLFTLIRYLLFILENFFF